MFRARIIAGSLTYNIHRFQEFCAANDGRWVTIEADKPERSISQLRMYRAWLHSVAEHSGNDEEALHEFLLDKCAPRVVATINGRDGRAVDIEQKKRTSGGHKLSMSVAEMVEYMEKCAALTGYPLPTQDELIAMGYLPH